jgi:hypothetical protein
VESDPQLLSAAAVYRGDGTARPVTPAVPRLGRVTVVGTSSGFVLAGVRCTNGDAMDAEVLEDEQLCSVDPDTEPGKAEPVLIGVNDDGIVEWTVTGPDAVPSALGWSWPMADGALSWVDGTTYVVDSAGFVELPSPTGPNSAFTPCSTSAGLVASVGRLQDESDDASGGTLQLFTFAGGTWEPMGEQIAMSGADPILSRCVPGGLVSSSAITTGRGSSPAKLDDAMLGAVVGVSESGAVLDGDVGAFVDSQTGEVIRPLPDLAHFTAVSWDGRSFARIEGAKVIVEDTP